MDSFELNKIVGAILGTLLFVMGVGFLAEAIYAPKEGPGPGYELPTPVEGASTTQAAAAAPKEEPLPVLLASASAEKGAKVAKKCESCHNFGKGEPNKVGPTLWDVVGSPIADLSGYSFSDALKAKNPDGKTVWTYASLNEWLTKPKDFAPGTKMSFAGISSATERADLLAYIATKADNPVPFPQPEAAPAAADTTAAPAAADNSAAPNASDTTAPAATETTAPAQSPAPADTTAPAQTTAPAETTAPAASSDQSSSATTAAPAAESAPASSDTQAAAPAAAAPAASGGSGLAAMLASADAAKGAKDARACQACHSFDKGGPNKVGPNLYDIVGRKIATEPGYSYSDALKAKDPNGDTAWTYDLLDQWLTKPKDFAPGTKMSYAGIAQPEKRADVLAYLQSLSDNPVPFPAN
ncbi:MAG TPA: cytochrome c family protein [Devosiaceae bacterium]